MGGRPGCKSRLIWSKSPSYSRERQRRQKGGGGGKPHEETPTQDSFRTPSPQCVLPSPPSPPFTLLIPAEIPRISLRWPPQRQSVSKGPSSWCFAFSTFPPPLALPRYSEQDFESWQGQLGHHVPSPHTGPGRWELKKTTKDQPRSSAPPFWHRSNAKQMFGGSLSLALSL